MLEKFPLHSNCVKFLVQRNNLFPVHSNHVSFTNLLVQPVDRACYIHKTIFTPVNEHLSWDRNSHIFKPLGVSKNCDDGKIIVISLVSKFIIDNATSF